MDEKENIVNISFSPANNQRLAALCGQLNDNIKLIEHYFNVSIFHRSDAFQISGKGQRPEKAIETLRELYKKTLTHSNLSKQDIHQAMTKSEAVIIQSQQNGKFSAIHTRNSVIHPKGTHQNTYINNIQKHDVIFGIGPAGTGKTYLAVACAVEALETGVVQRLVFVRPAVEAGEKLGFLPGDLEEKVLPYLRPLYDALFEMLGPETVARYTEKNIIEIAPLAYMRGRTLNDAFVILDEAQNTTEEQMKMFLTRLGFGSTAVITGDITQTDLPKQTRSGLRQAVDLLSDIPDISFNYFDANDSVRHPLVRKVILAYEKFEAQKLAEKSDARSNSQPSTTATATQTHKDNKEKKDNTDNHES